MPSLGFHGCVFYASFIKQSNRKHGSWVVWSPEEKRIAALAWKRASADPISGADQKADIFREKVKVNIAALALHDCDKQCYHYCSTASIFGHLRDRVFADIQKFNSVLRLVEGANLSGVDKQQKINMAVAIHLKKSSLPSYLFKSFDAYQWPNYLAWIELKDIPKFAVAKSSSSNSGEDDDVTDSVFDSSVDAEQVASTPKPNSKSRPGGRDMAKSKMLKNKKTDETRERLEEAKRLRLAIEHRNKQLESIGRLAQLKSVISLCGETHKDQVYQLKQQLLEETLRKYGQNLSSAGEGEKENEPGTNEGDKENDPEESTNSTEIMDGDESEVAVALNQLATSV